MQRETVFPVGMWPSLKSHLRGHGSQEQLAFLLASLGSEQSGVGRAKNTLSAGQRRLPAGHDPLRRLANWTAPGLAPGSLACPPDGLYQAGCWRCGQCRNGGDGSGCCRHRPGPRWMHRPAAERSRGRATGLTGTAEHLGLTKRISSAGEWHFFADPGANPHTASVPRDTEATVLRFRKRRLAGCNSDRVVRFVSA